MSKVLVLGCSYTRGSYSFHSNGDEELTGIRTWLDQLTMDIDHYTGWGVGYIQWVDIIESIELNNYSAVILQESVEPKFQLTRDAEWVRTQSGNVTRYELEENDIIFSKGLAHRPILQKQLGIDDPGMINYLHALGKHDSVLNITKACASHINNKLAQHNLPGYIIRTHEYVDYSNEHTHCKYLDLDPLFTIVGDDSELVNILPDGGQGHFTRVGNKLLAKLVAEAWNRREK